MTIATETIHPQDEMANPAETKPEAPEAHTCCGQCDKPEAEGQTSGPEEGGMDEMTRLRLENAMLRQALQQQSAACENTSSGPAIGSSLMMLLIPVLTAVFATLGSKDNAPAPKNFCPQCGAKI